jgi:hypothetical protein
VRLYVDGVEVGTGSARSAATDYALPTTRDLTVGDYAGCSGLNFDGAVDDPKVWGRALNADEVNLAFTGYKWKGFFSPVNNPPVANTSKAGSAVPVKFSLTGNQGLDVMADGSPASQKVACATAAPLDAIEETVSAGNSSLSYSASSDQYTYVWKTDKSWSGTCRELRIRLDDGSLHTAEFRFDK